MNKTPNHNSSKMINNLQMLGKKKIHLIDDTSSSFYQ